MGGLGEGIVRNGDGWDGQGLYVSSPMGHSSSFLPEKAAL